MKLSDSYESLSRGVSQQEPEDRLPGQHGEQVNLMTDPIKGLSRRRGTQLRNGLTVCNRVATVAGLLEGNAAALAAAEAWMASWRTMDYSLLGEEFAIHYPTRPIPPEIREANIMRGPVAVRKKSAAGLPASIVPINGINRPVIQDYFNRGFAASTQMGRYGIWSVNNTPVPSPAEQDAFLGHHRNHAVAWIRAGNYSRRYTIALTTAGGEFTASYTTPSSAYGGVLDTSDIPYSDPEYVKKVNDRVNAYNSAVTSWITTAAAQTRPEYIAQQLAISLNGFFPGMSFSSGANVFMAAPFPTIRAVTANDGGDGTAVRVVYQTVEDIAALTDHHVDGKVVEIKANRNDPAYYMKAVSSGSPGNGDWGPVRWVETARYTASPPAWVFPMLTMDPATRALHIGERSDVLDSLVPGLVTPTWGWRNVGDRDTSPTPHFVGRQVTYMGMFQDRLVLAAGSVVNMSQSGGYFEFFRTTVLTVRDDDPVEAYSIGSEDDTIRSSVLFDKSLILFGDKNQYSMDGTNPVTSATVTLVQSSATEDATDAPAVASGDLVFFAKRREGTSQLYQIEVGNVQDTSNNSELGLQLYDYIKGRPTQVLAMTSPNLVLLRTDSNPNSVFVYRYIDQNRQRSLDSWSRFDYGKTFGRIMGMSVDNDNVFMLVYREAVAQGGILYPGADGALGWFALESQSFLTDHGGFPHMDSLRPIDYHLNGEAHRDFHNQPFVAMAVGTGSQDGRWFGQLPAASTQAAYNEWASELGTVNAAHTFVGIPFDSYVTLTSPQRRDRNGKSVRTGRLTVGRLQVNVRETGGYYVDVKHNGQEFTALNFNGRLLQAGQVNNVGEVPLVDGTEQAPIGARNTDYAATIRSRTWLPMRITAINWTGQWFMNHRSGS